MPIEACLPIIADGCWAPDARENSNDMGATWMPHGCHMDATWMPHGCHMDATWMPSDVT